VAERRVLQDGVTALMHAALNGHTATAAELVRLGADINAKNDVRACEGVQLGSTHRG
jgi:ankyrin repeat protein